MSDTMTTDDRQKRTRRLLTALVLGTVLMFGFAFALVPLYDTLCRVLGVNGKVATEAQTYDGGQAAAVKPMNLEFVITKSDGLNWSFTTPERVIKVVPGKPYHIDFFATNNSDQDQTIQAIANVTPTELAAHLIKMECFCFSEQFLAAGESAVLPLEITVSPDVPDGYSTLTLSYTLYER